MKFNRFSDAGMKNWSRMMFVALTAFGVWRAEAYPAALTNGASVVVLSSNDSHGYVINGEMQFSQIAALKKELEADGVAVLLLDAGDFTQGSVAATYDNGQSLAQIVKATGYDAVTLGNHEFDYGVTQMIDTVTSAELPVTCCNFFETNGVTHKVTRPFPDGFVFERGGLRIGVVGVVTPKTISLGVSAKYKDPTNTYFQYDFDGRAEADDFYARVQQAVDAAAETCDAVVVVGHLGTEIECMPYRNVDLVANTTNVTVLVDGHSHEIIEETMLNAAGQEVLVTQTGCYLETLGWMSLDKDGKVLDYGRLTSLGATNETVYALETNLLYNVQKKFGEVVAVSPYEYIAYDAPPESTRVIRGREMNMGDLVADSTYWYANTIDKDITCDLAVINGGSVRANIEPGEVNLRKMNDIVPFGDTTVIIKTTGQTILDGLEWGAQSAGQGLFGGFLQVAGVRYDVATNVPCACRMESGIWLGGPTNGIYRVRNVQVYDRASQTWKPLDLTKEYNVAGRPSVLQQGCDGAEMWMDDSTVVAADSCYDYMTLAHYCEAFALGQGDYPELASEKSPLAKLPGYVLDYENAWGNGRIRFCLAEDVPFPAERVGVCSWSWATNMTTILTQMDTMGVKCMQLSLVPWVKPLYGLEYDASLRETFGKGESGDVFAAISNKIAKGEISVLSTMISFPFDRWGSYQAISNSNGIVCNIATNDMSGEAICADDPLGEVAWVVNSNLVDQAAAMTAQLGVEYITTELGYLDKPMIDHGTNANENAVIGLRRLYEVHRLCVNHGVKLLFESGQYSGEGTMALIDAYTNRYAGCELGHGLTVNDIGVNYDTANHLIYENDTPTNAFVVMRSRIPQIHVKDTYETRVDREKAGGFAVDVKWGEADVSVKYDTLAFLKAEGYRGNLLVEHEWGNDRVGDINAALRAILLANNEDPSDVWISPSVMTGATAGEQCEAALKAQGFSKKVAARLADAGLYGGFKDWAERKGLLPDELVAKKGVILAAAYDAEDVADPSKVKITIADMVTDSEDGTLAFTVAVGAEGYGATPANVNLLKAALGVEGSASLASQAFSPDTLDFVFGDVSAGKLPVMVAPKGETAPGGFFVRMTAE